MSLRGTFNFARRIETGLRARFNPVRRVLIDARTPMNYSVAAPIYRAMRDDSRVAFYFTSSEKPGRQADIFREAGCGARVITPRRAFPMKFDAYLASDILWARLLRGACRIQMFHGVAGKYGNVYDSPEFSMRDWDRLFFINSRRLSAFVRSGAIDGESRAARLVGMPKLDCLVDGSLKRDEVLTSLEIDPARQTVLYAPTWSPYSSLNAMGEELVEALCAKGYAVLVKLHDRSRDPEYMHSGGVDWCARLEPVLAEHGGVLAVGSNACPYLAAADVLITDHSSVGFEFMLLDRPVVRIEMPKLIAETNISPDYVDLLAAASTSVTSVKQALTAVEYALEQPAHLSEERRAVAREIFYEPGTATQRAVQELYQAIELDPPG